MIGDLDPTTGKRVRPADQTARLGRRTERSAAKRRNLITAARRVFHEKGYAAATIENIIDQAGGSRGTIYVHFRSKLSLLESVIREDAEYVAGMIDKVLSAIPRSDADHFTLAGKLVAAVTSEQTIALLRIVIAEQRNCPTIGDLYRGIVLPAEARMSRFLDQYPVPGAATDGQAISPLSSIALLADIRLTLLTGSVDQQDRRQLLSAAIGRLTYLFSTPASNSTYSTNPKDRSHEPG